MAKNTEKKCLAILDKHFSAVSSIALSEDGLTLLTAGRDKVSSQQALSLYLNLVAHFRTRIVFCR